MTETRDHTGDRLDIQGESKQAKKFYEMSDRIQNEVEVLGGKFFGHKEFLKKAIHECGWVFDVLLDPYNPP